MQQRVEAARKNIRLFLGECNVAYEVTPFAEGLYQDCIDDVVLRGYTHGHQSVLTFLRGGVAYAMTSGGHLPHRPTLIWIVLYTSRAIFVDEIADHFPTEMPNVYLFNERFILREPQGSDVLDAFADVLRRAPELFPPVASNFVVTSTLNFIAANLLEHETKSMKISSAAEQYPGYQRTLSGVAEAYSFMVFPREVPLNHYIQAIPEMTSFIHNVNDVLSFYKEERVGETTNQISTLAARTKKSKLELFSELTEMAIGLYKRILEMLNASPEACGAFRHYTSGYV